MVESELAGIRAVVLDLDDTLVSWQTVAHWQWSWRPNGPVLPERRVHAVLRRAQHRWDRLRWHSLAEPSAGEELPNYDAFLASVLRDVAGRPLPQEETQAVVRRFQSAIGGVELYSDARPFLDRQAAEGRTGRIATHLPRAVGEAVLRRVGVPPDRLVFAGDEPDFPAIPSRAGFRALATRVDLPVRAVLYVGDLFWSDYRAAGRAGLTSVWLDREGVGVETGARRVRDLTALGAELGTIAATSSGAPPSTETAGAYPTPPK